MIRKNLLALLLCLSAGFAQADDTTYPPKGFVFVQDVISDAAFDVRYFGANNFVGTRIDGYEAPEAILSVEAAVVLKAVSDDLRKQGYGLKIFDAYRPEEAVRHFVRWAADVGDIMMKARFYPDVDKAMLFEEGYIAERSGHSRGSVLDLTLIDLKSGQEIDMGSPFDLFGKISHHGAAGITPAQAANRAILLEAMEARGFSRLGEEWWHYRLEDEPYPETFFDFPVRAPVPVDAAMRQVLDKHADGAARIIVVAEADDRTEADEKNRAPLRAYARTDGVWTLRFSTDGWLDKDSFKAGKCKVEDGATFRFGHAFGYADDPGALMTYEQIAQDDDRSSARNYGKHKYAMSIVCAPSVAYAPVLLTADNPAAIAVSEAAMVFFLGFIEQDTLIAFLSFGR
ncbi:MAG: M15 family metallopeptidase [Betaproteobacteria bacterium]|nr:M15 family metallopeptidase [Betaproteobacteria bacterium]